MSNKLYSIIAKIMGVSESDVTDESGPETIANWTSFNSYVLLYQLESEFNVKFTIDEAVDVKIVADIKRHLKNHGVNFNE
jgi:acyl carrier protein|tara:strand:- start:475 stop:714 length:240 start_codon:yes stop_codon:yes gene_type:complete